MNKNVFFKSLYLSFFSKNLYEDVAENWSGRGILYFLFLTLFLAFFVSIRFRYNVLKYLNSDIIPIVKQIPEATFANGEIDIQKEQPIFVSDKKGNPFIIIDTTGKITSLTDTNYPFLLTRTSLYRRINSNETKTYSFPRFSELSIAWYKVMEWLSDFILWLNVLFYPVIATAYFLLGSMFAIFCYCVGIFLSKIYRLAVPFRALLRLSFISLTPAVVVTSILYICLGHIGISGLIIFILLALGYFLFALKSSISAYRESFSFNLPILRSVVMPFYSADFYKNVAQNWKGMGFYYLIWIVSLSSLLLLVRLHIDISKYINNEIVPVVNQMPEIYFRNGAAIAKEAKPYYISPRSNYPIALIDTTGEINSITDSKYLFLLTNHNITIKLPWNSVLSYNIPKINDFSISKEWLLHCISDYNKYSIYILYIVILPFAVFLNFVYRLLQALLLAGIGIIFANITRTRLSYNTLVRLSIVSITPIIIANGVLFLLGLRPGILWFAISFIVPMVYLFFACKVNASNINEYATNDRYTILHPFYMSFYSGGLYKDVANTWTGNGLLYLLILTVMFSIPLAVKINSNIFKNINDKVIPLAQKLPDINISDGKVSAPITKPYFIDTDSGKPIAIIDTTGTILSLEGTRYKFLLTNQNLIRRINNDQMLIYDLPKGYSITITKDKFLYGVNIFKNLLKFLFPAVFIPIFVLFNFLWKTLEILLFAVICLFIARVKKIELSYTAAMRLTTVAITPSIIITNLLLILGIQIPALIFILLSISVIIYILFATARLRETE